MILMKRVRFVKSNNDKKTMIIKKMSFPYCYMKFIRDQCNIEQLLEFKF
jgi:hypothetical protein